MGLEMSNQKNEMGKILRTTYVVGRVGLSEGLAAQFGHFKHYMQKPDRREFKRELERKSCSSKYSQLF